MMRDHPIGRCRRSWRLGRRAACGPLGALLLVTAGALATATAATTGSASAASAAAPHPVLAPHQGSYVFTLEFDGLTRDYRLHVPPAAIYGQPLPLVLNLHGATQNGQLEELTSDMDANADTNGYLVAYPDGTRISKVLTPDPVAKNAQYGWNAGECCGLPVTKHINDVGFLLKVISDIAARTPVNLRKVYMTGISNGGMMAYAMADEASDHFAAISSVSGQVEIPTTHPTRAVPTMEFHSVNDPIAKYNGTPNANPKLRLSVMEGIDQWVKADGCSPAPHVGTTIVGAPGSISAGETATPITYTHCHSGAEVALWRFTGSGHVWPGSPLNTGPKKTWILAGVGRGIVLVNANETMWEFFSHYELPAAPK
jgi:polyhydroxybutyrate depolymerase